MSANPRDHAELLKRSLLAIDQLEAKLAGCRRRRAASRSLLRVSACRSPGDANDPESFWKLMLKGVDAVTEVPSDRLGHGALFRPGSGCGRQDVHALGRVPAQRRSVRRCVLRHFPSRGTERSIRNSACCWSAQGDALEHAGISPASLMGTQASVFVGISTHDYSLRGEQYRQGPLGRCVHRNRNGAQRCFRTCLVDVLGLDWPERPRRHRRVLPRSLRLIWPYSRCATVKRTWRWSVA